MEQPGRPADPSQSRRRRIWLIGAVAFVVLPVAGFLGLMLYNRAQTERALQRAIEHADKTDPAWRLEDIESRRLALPMKQNAAGPVTYAAKAMPAPWTGSAEARRLEQFRPNSQLDPALTGALRQKVRPLRDTVLVRLREAMRHQRGWFLVQWSPDYIGTVFPHLLTARDLAEFLTLDAALRNEGLDHGGAWESGLNILALCRAIGEEPSGVAQVTRQSLRAQAVECLEQTLAQGIVEDEALAEAQRWLAAEASEPVLLFALRGERAGMHMLLSNLESGALDWKRVLDTMDRNARRTAEQVGNLLDDAIKRDHAEILDHYNRAIEIAQGPPWELLRKTRFIVKTRNEMSALVRFLLPDTKRLVERYLQSQAQLDCAIAALGVERYRRQFGAWPKSLDDLVAAKLLDKVPRDVYDSRVLEYRKTADGVVVYSPGPEATFRGDALDDGSQSDPHGRHHEFRLWNPDKRRQPVPGQNDK